MNDYIEMRELKHVYGETQDSFFAKIDSFGGWPVGYKYVSFFHGNWDNRYCSFTNTFRCNDWWTTVYTSDDYYFWKLTEEKKLDIFRKNKSIIINQLQNLKG